MPGGRLDIKISQNFAVTMTGGVTKVAEGIIDPEMFLTRLAPPVS
jgi:diaminopimelate epimerase